MRRYTEEHYEDVARLLSKHDALNRPVERADSKGHRPMEAVAKDFADLFAADSPRSCSHCYQPDEATATKACHAFHQKHNFVSRFDRTAFLRACGIKP